MKMATYPGMSLRGEVRESISLDDDDLSDVEDEVFIRDGKNGYKLAEELNVKRPLMAPRRKPGRQDLGTRLKRRPPCREFCKPCCYVSAALSVLIGLIILVVIIVSMYPLPLDRLRDWVIKKSETKQSRLKLSPCNNLKITEIWSVNLPKLTTDSPIRTLDVNGDGLEDILFGFSVGDNTNLLPPDIFCPMFMGVPPPCEGGVIALNGINGDIIWRHWLNDTIFSLHCTADVNGDTQNDCLAVGVAGTLIAIDTKNGTTIWKLNTGKLNVYVANFIPDQNNDSVPDILASHSSLNAATAGSITLFSGKTGKEINSIEMPNGAKSFYMPQILIQNTTSRFVLFGTGSPSLPGSLNAAPFADIFSKSLSNRTKLLYTDMYKGVLTQSILVDITGDNVPDIVTAMYNSTIVAINGKTFEQIWNYTVSSPNSETNVVPTPGYFNLDNVTDFLVIYQKYDDVLNYNYTQTFIIDGKTGESIYSPISGSVISQMGGLTLSMESHGYDMYLFWTAECTNIEMFKKVNIPNDKSNEFYDECRRQFNTTKILRLNALNQFHEPPGFTVYSSVDHIQIQYNNTKSAMKHVREYYHSHPKIEFDPPGQTEVDENYNVDQVPIGIRKYGASNFRHKDGHTGIIKDYMGSSEGNSPISVEQEPQSADQDYDWQQNQPASMLNTMDELDPDFSYQVDDSIPYNQKRLLLKANNQPPSGRDPRSKDKKINSSKPSEAGKDKKVASTSKKKNLSDKKDSIYDYHNVRLARNRLLHDVNNIPTEILKDTFFKNEERRLRKSKFEQRDINSHNDKIKENEEIQGVIDEEQNAIQNSSLNLWDLESEKEMQDWESGNYRGKREVNYTFESVKKITSVGAIVSQAKNVTNHTNSIEIVFITYWQPSALTEDLMLKQDMQDCVEDKMLKKSEDQNKDYQKTTDKEQRALYRRECSAEQTNLKNDFAYFKQLSQLRLGQMTVYRVRIDCECVTVNNKGERCAKFLPKEEQNWPSYLGKYGDGVFLTRN